MLYIAFEGDDSAIQWCQFCVSLSGSLFNSLFNTMADGINYTGDLPRNVLDCLFDHLTDKYY